ncbi:MAG: P-loop domain-containing protein [Brevinema sp.]
MHNLKTKLQRFHKCKYPLYQGLLGEYNFGDFIMVVDYVQADPFAPPSKITLKIPFEKTHFDLWFIDTPVRCYSFCDILGRILAAQIRSLTKDDKGSGNGGFCGIRYGAQKVIESNAIIVKDQHIECRILAGLPGFGRTIAGIEAQEFLLQEIPKVVRQSFFDKAHHVEIKKFVCLTEQQHYLREECRKRGIVSFIANGSILARASAVSDKPMSHQKAIVFQSPKELETTITLPDGLVLSGMAIPKGITLIAGGGFHGKSTLLSAVSHAIYNHIPNDGREYCITDDSAVFLRAEEGRFIEGLNISPFIHNLPGYKSSHFFQSENASGSSSQAANLIEACEMGSKLLLIDEDVSATNFLIRDTRMRALVADYKETITPLIAHINNLKKHNISLIMVTGALGDFMHVADRVIVADNYQYYDKTEDARNVMHQYPLQEIPAQNIFFQENRIIDQESIDYLGKKGAAMIGGEQAKVFLGRETIDLSAWNHLYDVSQYGTLAAVLAYAKEKHYFDQSPQQVWKNIERDLKQQGWDLLSYVGLDHLSKRQEARKEKYPTPRGQNWRYIVKTRPLDWHAALCRLRSLKCEEINNKV